MKHTTGASGRNAEERNKEEVVDAFYDWVTGRLKHWSDCFFSEAHARSILGRLRDCDDLLPGLIQVLTNDEFDPSSRDIKTYDQLAQHMMADLNQQALLRGNRS